MANNYGDFSNDLSELLKSINGCEYVDLDNDCFRDKDFVVSKNNINVLHLNIRSAMKNLDNLRLLLNDLCDHGIVIHLIGLCKTFLTSGTDV